MGIVKFGDVVQRANTKEDKDNTSKIYYVGGEHIESDNVLISNRGIIKGSTIGPMFYFGFKSGQILFVSRNPHLRKAGMVTFDGICSEKTFVLETKDETILLQRYLAFVMQSNNFWEYMEAHKSGSVNYFINWSTLADYEFNLPDIEEQYRISELLWAINDTKQSYINLLKSIDEVVKSQFIEMFGSEDFPVAKLLDLCDVITKGTTPTTIGYNFVDAGISFIKIENIAEDGRIITDEMMYIDDRCNETMKRSQLKSGDILFSIAGAIGRTAIVTDELLPANINQALAIVRLKEDAPVSRGFLMATLQSGYIEKQYMTLKRGVAQLNLSLKDVGSFIIPLPTMEKQNDFVKLAKQSDKSKFELKKALANLTMLYKQVIEENLN